MSLPIKKFTYAPVYVDAVPVTKDNMPEVAKWCEGEICKEDNTEGTSYIKVNVMKPQTPRQGMAFDTDWVIRLTNGFKVYTDKAFRRSFVPTPD